MSIEEIIIFSKLYSTIFRTVYKIQEVFGHENSNEVQSMHFRSMRQTSFFEWRNIISIVTYSSLTSMTHKHE